MKPLLWAVLLIAGLCSAGIVATDAEAAPPSAKEHARKARQLDAQGKIDDAIAEYRLAYEMSHDPSLIFNIALLYKKKGARQEAIVEYNRYLELAPNGPTRDEAREARDSLERERSIESAPPVQVPSQDAQPPREAHPSGASAPPVLPGTKPGSFGPSEASNVKPPLFATEAPGSSPWYRDYIGWTLVGAGVAAVAVGAGLHLSAASAESDLPTVPEASRPSERDSIGTRRTIGTIGLAAGAALVAGGIVKFALTGRTERPSTAVLVGPASLGLLTHF